MLPSIEIISSFTFKPAIAAGLFSCISEIFAGVKSFPENIYIDEKIKIANKKIPHYHVVVGLIRKNKKFLISKRFKNKFLGGLWELPGGKIKKGESARQCLKREIKEELDIQINIKDSKL